MFWVSFPGLGYFNFALGPRTEILTQLKKAGVTKWFAGHYHRNVCMHPFVVAFFVAFFLLCAHARARMCVCVCVCAGGWAGGLKTIHTIAS